MSQKRMLITIGSMGRGGAERVISVLSNYYAGQKGRQIRILTLLDNKIGYDLHENISVIDASGNTNSRLKRLPGWIKAIRQNVKEFKPDVVLSFVARVNIITLIACAGLKKKVVVSERNDPSCDGRGKPVDFFSKLLYPKAYAVVFQTKRAAGYFENCKLKNSVIIANPINILCEASEPTRGKIVTVGRLAPQKNQAMLLRAFSDVLKTHAYAHLHLFGSGDLEEELKKLAHELNIDKSVTFEGSVPDVHIHIADAECFVLSSDYEGLSNALLEAQMMGLPCITTDCAGSDEYIENGVNGIITKIGDRAAMTDAVNRVLDDSEAARSMGAEAKRRSSRFMFDSVIEQWNGVLN